MHPSLEAALREKLGPGPWSHDQLAAVMSIRLTDGQGTLAGLEALPAFANLMVRRWSGLALPALPHLYSIDLGDCDLTSIEPLRGHPGLTNVTLTGCCIEDLTPLLELPSLGLLVLEALPLDERSYREVLPALAARGVSLVGVERNFPEVAWRMMRRLAERGLAVVAVVDDFGKTRLYAPGSDSSLSAMAVIDEGELSAILDEHEGLDTEGFMARAREVFRARLRAERDRS